MDFISAYFQAEKTAGLLFIGIGAAAIALSFVFWFGIKRPFVQGLAWPLLLIGLAESAAGAAVALRSANDIERVENHFVLEPEKINTDEIPRMNDVMKRFVFLRYAEISLLIAGAMIALVARSSMFLKGLGAGLMMQAAVALIADHYAEERANRYLQKLNEYGSDALQKS